MPRDLALGNGSLLVNFDSRYRVRDIYYPRVGSENQTGGRACRFGIGVDGQFSWISNDEWSRDLDYADNTLVTNVRLRNPRLGVELVCADAVDFDRPIFVRRIVVKNLVDRERTFTLYFHADFWLERDGIGDTAYFDPWTQGIVHYKRNVQFLCNAQVGDRVGFEEFSVGGKSEDASQGTWLDAEDGRLEANAIAQGQVDSVGSAGVTVEAGGEGTAHYWIVASDDFFRAKDHNDTVVARTPESFIQRTRDYWSYWITRDPTDLWPLAPRSRRLYRRSMLVVRTQIDDGGAIVAANDSDILQFGRDTYSYMWPRDGALVAEALIGANQRELAGRFFQFCRRALQPGGFMLHKYHPDGSPGSSWHPWANADRQRVLPIQEDETALVLWALSLYNQRFQDTEFIRGVYAPLIKGAADFLVRYRHEPSGLPAASWDLWEERLGIHTFTVASVWAGLEAAAEFAEGFGELETASRYRTAAAEIRTAALKHLYSEEHRRFIRRVEVNDDGSLTPDLNIDASVHGVWRFGMFDADDSRVRSTMESVRDELTVKTQVGGVARYQNDYYHQVSSDIQTVPGNPWFICTLWLAQWYVALAATSADLEPARDILAWVTARALPSGTLAEQVHPYSGAPLSVSPLTWSHAEFATTVQKYAEKAAQIA